MEKTLKQELEEVADECSKAYELLEPTYEKWTHYIKGDFNPFEVTETVMLPAAERVLTTNAITKLLEIQTKWNNAEDEMWNKVFDEVDEKNKTMRISLAGLADNIAMAIEDYLDN